MGVFFNQTKQMSYQRNSEKSGINTIDTAVLYVGHKEGKVIFHLFWSLTIFFLFSSFLTYLIIRQYLIHLLYITCGIYVL